MTLDADLPRPAFAPGRSPAQGRRDGEAVGRVPPHNLQAEESLLGAMLLSRDAIANAVEVVAADDFYKPAHGHIFEAVTSLFAAGEPVDPVTVAEELSRAQLLDAIGGPATLVTIQANTPATTSAARYARIVEEHSLLRRLIQVAGEIAELGYTLPDDVAKAVDHAEALVFRVAQRRVTDTLAPIRELLSASLDRLEQLYEHGESITGIPTGYVDLDELLSGMQPSNLIVAGARPAMGKALALDTPIPTPTGWTTMGAIRLGDAVFDEEGQTCRVTYVSPVFIDRVCYEVEFDDGSALVADAEHQWFAYDYPAWTSLARDQSGRVKHPRVVTTQTMLDEGVRRGDRPNWYVPLALPLDLPDGDLPVDPYLFGCWLGDGRLRHLPRPYLRAPFKQRLALLQGIMDTDGTVTNGNGTVELCLADLSLLQDVRELVCSLGHKPGAVRHKVIPRGDGRATEAWRFRWAPLDPVFRMPGKARRLAAQASKRRFGRMTRRAVVAIRRVPTVAVRCVAVDSPSHLYLAGESMIPTHNTSFALGIATHVAVQANKPVLIFSLEMSQMEVSQRILCAEARVDSTKVRTGKLSQGDWTQISHAVGRLADAPIFVDDNANISVMEIRAKSRRLKSSTGGLGLVVIDYVQLMTGRHGAESRQVEVSEISRGLKILARELDCPVLALAQLNRQLEQRADKRPMLADLRESGCLTADTRLLRADTNAEVTLGELVEAGARDVPVWSLDRDLRMVPARMKRAFASGVKLVFGLRLASGRTVSASANHPFLTIEGWRRLDELEVGSRIAVPRVVPEPLEPSSWPDDDVILLAHLLGDGCFVSRQPLHYTSGDTANIDVVEKAARSFGVQPRRVPQGTWTHLYLSAGRGLARGRRNPIVAWLDGLGLYGLRSHEKFVPREVFGLSRRQIALFLHHLWSTDGSLGVFKRGDGDMARIYYASTSRRLIDDVQLLLSRFGILTRVATTQKGEHRPGYQLIIAGSVSMGRFLDDIGVHGRRGRLVPPVRERLAGTTKDAYCDALPQEVTDLVRRAVAGSGLSHAEACRRAGMTQYRIGHAAVPRWRLKRLADVLDDDVLRMLATSDVHWDRVVAVDALGEQPVFDATVGGTHNFVANGITAENSLEQDSDVVVFLYRDEIYNPETPDRGTAEILVAKHRSGPTGKIRLAWLDRYTKFANMAKGM